AIRELADPDAERADVVAELSDARAVGHRRLRVRGAEFAAGAQELVVRARQFLLVRRGGGRGGARTRRARAARQQRERDGQRQQGRGPEPGHGRPPGAGTASVPPRNASASSLSLITSAA